MPKDLLIGIDIGTTSVKAVLFDGQGAVLGEAAHEHPTAYPHPNWAEQDPEDWWRGVCHTLHRIFAGSPRPATDVAAIGVSCQAPTIVAVDRAGTPLYPAILWLDRRTDPQCAWLRQRAGSENVTRINGGRIDAYYSAPKLLWLQQERPDILRRTHAVLHANGYIVHRLTGVFSLDLSHGPLTLCFDSRAGRWSHQLLQDMGFDPGLFPPLFPCSDIVGEVTAQAAADCGLAPGTPVIAGMNDGTAAAIEAGVIEPGDAVEMTGQSTVLLICSDQPYLADQLIPLGHPIPGRHLVVGALSVSGGALRWVRDQIGEPERSEALRRGLDPFELLTETAAASPPGANRLVFLPYMFGERSPIWDSNARGVFFGLSLATTKADLVRAVLEGAAYGLRHNVETAAAAGFAAGILSSVGGGARSPLWNQIKADVLQRPIRLPHTAIGAPLGDAIVAAAGAGLYSSIAGAAHGMNSFGATFEPRIELAARYDALYGVYLGLYPALAASYRQLAEAPCD